ncbi:MAG: endonuclease [Mucilaginibacter sp.]|nr:endonuclease [Mucilaginibacter sp.]
MNCYNCGTELTDTNRSEEHIINNALGGHLTSDELLCKPCNDQFGHGIDSDIEKQIGQVTYLLGIKRHRKNKDRKIRIEMCSDTGAVKVVGKNMEPWHELSLDTGDQKVVIFESEANYEALKNRKKKELSKKFKVEDKEYIRQPDKTKYRIKNSLSDAEGNTGFGGPEFFRAAAKMCLNYYLSKGYDRNYCQDVIAYIKGEKKFNDIGYFYYPKHYRIHELGDKEVSHIIHIKGDTQYKLLYAYIELFNAHNAIIIFSLNYNGDAIDATYAYDLLEGKEMTKTIKIWLPRHHLEIMDLIAKEVGTEHVRKFNRLERIIEKRQLINDSSI